MDCFEGAAQSLEYILGHVLKNRESESFGDCVRCYLCD